MPTWISAAGLLVVLVTIVWRDGQFRGRILTVLELLTEARQDHEDRIRDLESGRQQGGHGQLLDRRRR